ncbi:MAG: hypothetical protein ACPGVG_00380 [Mycobacterium sp.]
MHHDDLPPPDPPPPPPPPRAVTASGAFAVPPVPTPFEQQLALLLAQMAETQAAVAAQTQTHAQEDKGGLARTLENPLVRLMVGICMTLVAAYVSVQVTRIDGQLSALQAKATIQDRRIKELEMFRAAHEASHREREAAGRDRLRRWDAAIQKYEGERRSLIEEWRAKQRTDQ